MVTQIMISKWNRMQISVVFFFFFQTLQNVIIIKKKKLYKDLYMQKNPYPVFTND